MIQEKGLSSEKAVREFVKDRFENFLVVPPNELPEVGAAIMTIDAALPQILSGKNRVLAYRVFATPSGRLTAEGAWFNKGGLAPADWGPLGPQGLKGRPGGVWEWSRGWYSGTASRARFSVDPVGLETGEAHVLRGGSWCFIDPVYLRAAFRNYDHPDSRVDYVGFRLVAALQDSIK